MGILKVADSLKNILKEEHAIDIKLTRIAEKSVNPKTTYAQEMHTSLDFIGGR